MLFDITHLKKVRKQLNLTQHQFAKEAGVSQSMIAKIEAEKLDPTYSHVKKIEEAIERITKNDGPKAGDIMHKGVISVSKDEPVSNVIQIMTKHNISQIPVINYNNLIGMISESVILDKTLDDFKNKKAGDIMTESPPIISESTKFSVIVSLLKVYPIVLVGSSGKMAGVIAKADIIKILCL